MSNRGFPARDTPTLPPKAVSKSWNNALSLFRGFEFEASLAEHKRLLRQINAGTALVVLNDPTGKQTTEVVAQLWFNIGAIKGVLGEYWLAAEAFTKSVENDPALVVGWYGLGIAKFQLKQFRKSYKVFMNCLALMDRLSVQEVKVDYLEMCYNSALGNGNLPNILITGQWTLERTRVDWNTRQAIFEKNWKAKRATRPGHGRWGINGIPLGVLFIPKKPLAKSSITMEKDPPMWYDAFVEPKRSEESQLLGGTKGVSVRSSATNFLKPLPPLPMSSTPQIPKFTAESPSELRKKQIAKVKAGTSKRQHATTSDNTIGRRDLSTTSSSALTTLPASVPVYLRDSTDVPKFGEKLFENDSEYSVYLSNRNSTPQRALEAPSSSYESFSAIDESGEETPIRPQFPPPRSDSLKNPNKTHGPTFSHSHHKQHASEDRHFLINFDELEGAHSVLDKSARRTHTSSEIIDSYRTRNNADSVLRVPEVHIYIDDSVFEPDPPGFNPAEHTRRSNEICYSAVPLFEGSDRKRIIIVDEGDDTVSSISASPNTFTATTRPTTDATSRTSMYSSLYTSKDSEPESPQSTTIQVPASLIYEAMNLGQDPTQFSRSFRPDSEAKARKQKEKEEIGDGQMLMAVAFEGFGEMLKPAAFEGFGKKIEGNIKNGR
ncbi:hypothetical protein MMC06_002219 [Schaereria dolodes]|nr:hypothetical protein [Schaereria dolodes]